jgi:F0F1-type ATP synthase assembly protein I
VELRDRRETYRGFGDGLARAFEIAMMPVLFGAGGWALDRWLGTTPLFIIITVLVAVIGLATRSYYTYVAEMQAHDAKAPWGRAGKAGSA